MGLLYVVFVFAEVNQSGQKCGIFSINQWYKREMHNHVAI